jgi:asparagine synthase (glutamine-hydrolysing)
MPRWVNTAQCKVFFNKEYFADLKETAIDRLISTLPDEFHTWDSFNKAQYLECKTLLSNYLLCSQGDRMLMANTVEGRFPFLDHEVIEFASRLPLSLKMKVLNEKYLLKRAFANKLPKNVIQRYKQPYRAPNIPLFFSGKPPEYVSELLSEDTIKKFGYFDYKKVKLFLERIKKGNNTNKDNMAFIGILSTQLLHYQFKELS